ncbi:peptidase S8/S53 domain-containing protein [Zychaea mexicana]|uniref:peptidase S8/S53 domain-containing protein n=1 Tax=Zychaea mexicana TaxID=64656 RepID=UPI0022FF0F7B|nr:peptidase S8/S53 domain-containing protein [Zychaea mexicana]KAI9498728.1 peptidase S8/S53 domain-containing protein [Zychaea mexicana]
MVKLNILTSSVLLLAGFANALPTLDDWLSSDAELAPLFHSPEAETISDSYIVVLKDHVDMTAAQSHCHWVSSFAKRDESLIEYLDADAAAGIKLTYDSPGWRGYAGKFSPETLHHIRSSPEVAYVEKDSIMYASELQRNAPWGLSRIAHRGELTLRTFNKYSYDENGGEGVKVFVIDTGINVDHHDFHGRASWGATFAKDGDTDGNGHGSHCAGTISGQRFGVAKKANPVAVKVLSAQGSGSNSEVLAGINWAVEQHQIDAAAAKKNGSKYKGAVANMSLGGGKSRALDQAVNNAVDAGVIFSVAAGNDNRDACKYSPAAAENAITVGATNLRDERAYFSNYGECVDVFAPGQDIMSVWNTSPYSTMTISGTSMAAPHVAGLAAYFLSLEEGENVTPKMIKDKIIEFGTSGKLGNIPSKTPNLIVFNNFSTA